MCGITGSYSRDNNLLSEEEFRFFNSSLSHRGPDNQDVVHSGLAWLGHNRLSIIDLTEEANQPFFSKNSQHSLYMVFNGEIYNYLEIREELKTLGHRFETNSDTEVVLKSYIEWGEKCQLKFNGMWGLAIYNTVTDELFLSRDRFGVKPLYVYIRDGSLFFASEVKAFRRLPISHRLKCDRDLLTFLSQRPDNSSTLHKGVSALPAGHSLLLKNDKSLILKKWWNIESYIPDLYTENTEDLVERFRELFNKALSIRLRSDAKICSALSGGLDSSSVVSSIPSLRDSIEMENFKAFIFEYQGSRESEASYAKEVCFYHKIPYTLCQHHPLTSTISEEKIVDCIFSSEQLGNLQIGPYLIYQSMANENYKVSIDGHGADEILGGYKQFALPSLADAYFNEREEGFHKTMQAWVDASNNPLIDPQSYLKAIKKMSSEKNKNIDGQWMRRARLQELNHKTLPWILKTYDMMPMRHGIEVRSPFLDWNLATFSLGLENKHLINNGFNKFILREALKTKIPSKTLKRKSKLGFLPSKYFYLRLKCVKKLILDTISSQGYEESPFFDGRQSANLIDKALIANNYETLDTLWPTIQLTIFTNQWNRA